MTKSSDPRPPTCHQVDAGPVHWEVRVSEPEVTLIKADHIQVERSTEPRYIPLKSGYIEVYSTVRISVEGTWHELTAASIQAEEGQPASP